jgi:sRNA-binding regulator protein Hfq
MGIRNEFGFEGDGPIKAYVPRRQSRPRLGLRDQAPRKEGHDALIESLRHKNTWIHITALDSGDTLSGRLMQSDRFTISYIPDGQEFPTVMFKHAIESFRLEVRE